MEKRALVRWLGSLGFEAESADGARLPLGGEAEPAFGPAALMLAALAGCTGMDAISIMQKKRQRVERYEVEVSGEQREEHPRTFVTITVDHIVAGERLADVAVARAIELSARKYCVVGATIAAGDTAIQHRFRITDEAGERTCDCVTIGPRGAGLSVEPAGVPPRAEVSPASGLARPPEGSSSVPAGGPAVPSPGGHALRGAAAPRSSPR